MYHSEKIEIAFKGLDMIKLISIEKHINKPSFNFINSIKKFPIYLGILLISLFMRLGLYFIHKILKVEFENFSFKIKSPSNYKKARQQYDSLSKGINQFNRSDINEISEKDVKFGLKGLFSQIINMYNLIEKHHSHLRNYINSFDASCINSSSFQYISEENLWSRRTKAYNYRL